MPRDIRLTASWTYLRFHGGQWDTGYGDEELAEWAGHIRAFRGHYSPEHHEGMEVPGIYWHFVDIMWIVVYTTVYVL